MEQSMLHCTCPDINCTKSVFTWRAVFVYLANLVRGKAQKAPGMRAQQGCSKWKQALCRRAVVSDVCDAADFTVRMCQTTSDSFCAVGFALNVRNSWYLRDRWPQSETWTCVPCCTLCSKLTDKIGTNCYDCDFFFLRKRKEVPRKAGTRQPQLLNQWECTCITTGHPHVFSHTWKHDCHTKNLWWSSQQRVI